MFVCLLRTKRSQTYVTVRHPLDPNSQKTRPSFQKYLCQELEEAGWGAATETGGGGWLQLQLQQIITNDKYENIWTFHCTVPDAAIDKQHPGCKDTVKSYVYSVVRSLSCSGRNELLHFPLTEETSSPLGVWSFCLPSALFPDEGAEDTVRDRDELRLLPFSNKPPSSVLQSCSLGQHHHCAACSLFPGRDLNISLQACMLDLRFKHTITKRNTIRKEHISSRDHNTAKINCYR